MAKGRKTGGRQRGVPNHATQEVKAFTEQFLGSAAYVRSAKKRVLAGQAPHLEVLWHHYAYGKPKDRVVFEGHVPAFILKVEAAQS